ncbi:hypothetical protein P9112_008557 [Eukaryota sp. TZLM1-RC]
MDEHSDLLSSSVGIHIAVNDLLRYSSDLLGHLWASFDLITVTTNTTANLSKEVSSFTSLITRLTSFISQLFAVADLTPPAATSPRNFPPSPSLANAAKQLRLSQSIGLPLADLGLRCISFQPQETNDVTKDQIYSIISHRREVVASLTQHTSKFSLGEAQFDQLGESLSRLSGDVASAKSKLSGLLNSVENSGLLEYFSSLSSSINSTELLAQLSSIELDLEKLQNENDELKNEIFSLRKEKKEMSQQSINSPIKSPIEMIDCGVMTSPPVHEDSRFQQLSDFYSKKVAKLENDLNIALGQRREAELLLSEQNIELARLASIIQRNSK